MRKISLLIFGLLLNLGTGVASAEVYNYSVAGASPGGLWTSLGVGIDAAVKAAYPGSTITYQTSGGGIANIVLLQQKKAQMGIVHDAELKIAADGDAPFKAPVRDLRALVTLYDWAPMQVFMTKAFADKYGIKTFEDIAAKKPPIRVALNKRGNIAHDVGVQMLKAIGVTSDDVKKWGGEVILAASSEQTDMMKDRRADLLINSLFVKHGSLLELEQSVNVVLLPLSRATIGKVAVAAGIKSFTVPAGSYKLQPNPVPTVTLSAGLIVNAAMDEKTAYNLTKALVQNIGKIKEVHKSMQALTPQLMASPIVVPNHPGAVRYFREAGLSR